MMGSRVGALFGMICLVLQGTPGQAQAGRGTAAVEVPGQAEDAVINARVVRELLLQPGVRADQVQTETRGGVVHLTGRVPNVLAKERAVEIARAVTGVRAVVDEVDVVPPLRSDARIRSDVVEAWALDPVTETYQLFLEVEGGHLRLSGAVASHQERQLAERLAKGVIGVRSVTNDVVLRPSARRMDQEIRADILSRLHWDVRLDDRAVEVRVEEGVASLTGWVSSASDRAIASELAWVQGIRRVDNKVEVRPAARPRLLTKDARPVRADLEIEAAVLAALEIDPRVPPGIGVVASDGVVTLRGAVPTPLARQMAERDALNTVGVWAVRNELVVDGAQAPDELLETRVERTLQRDAWLGDLAIRSACQDGVVFLYGTVESEALHGRAFEAVAGLAGVREVADRIVVVTPVRPLVAGPSPPEVTDFALAQAVRNRLFWSRYVRSPVRVTVEGKRVKLTGTVSSWFEAYKAELAAWEAGAGEVQLSGLVVQEDQAS